MNKDELFLNLQQRWYKFAPRERTLLAIGSFVIGITLIYILIISPYNEYMASLKNEISKKQGLIQWMQTAATKITQLKTEGLEVKSIGDQSLLTIIDQSARINQIDRFITQLSQAGNNKVNIEFNTVPFDDLIKWIDKLWREYGIQVSKINITPTKTAGLIKAETSLEMES